MTALLVEQPPFTGPVVGRCSCGAALEQWVTDVDPAFVFRRIPCSRCPRLVDVEPDWGDPELAGCERWRLVGMAADVELRDELVARLARRHWGGAEVVRVEPGERAWVVYCRRAA